MDSFYVSNVLWGSWYCCIPTSNPTREPKQPTYAPSIEAVNGLPLELPTTANETSVPSATLTAMKRLRCEMHQWCSPECVLTLAFKSSSPGGGSTVQNQFVLKWLSVHLFLLSPPPFSLLLSFTLQGVGSSSPYKVKLYAPVCSHRNITFSWLITPQRASAIGRHSTPMHQRSACIWLKIQYITHRSAIMMMAGVPSGSSKFLSGWKANQANPNASTVQWVLQSTDAWWLSNPVCFTELIMLNSLMAVKFSSSF